MKVKTAEALMFGKHILGTEEALVGYDNLDDCICSSADDFITKIMQSYENRHIKYCQANRELYLEKYSVKSLERYLKKILVS